MRKIALLLILCISFLSCGRIYLRLIGVKQTKAVTKHELTSFLNKHQLNPIIVLELDSAKYAALIEAKKRDTLTYKSPDWWIQNHVQPVQVIYYDNKEQKPLAAYFNCIAEGRGLTNFTWNKNHELDTFPPKTYTDWRWRDTLFTMNEIVSTFHSFDDKPFLMANYNKRYQIFVFYSLFVEKQSNNLIQEVNMHINKFIKSEADIHYINMDNYFYHAMK